MRTGCDPLGNRKKLSHTLIHSPSQALVLKDSSVLWLLFALMDGGDNEKIVPLMLIMSSVVLKWHLSCSLIPCVHLFPSKAGSQCEVLNLHNSQ